MIKIAAAAALTGALLAAPAYAGGPEMKDGAWYYRDDEGELITGCFVTIDGISYYFGTDGKLASGRTVQEGSDLYGLYENGAMMKDTWGIFTENGRTVRRYFGYLGKAFRNGWLQVNDRTYHFTESVMDYGWYTDENGNIYFLGDESDGSLHTGWFIWKGEDLPEGDERTPGWYYFRTGSGTMVADREIQIGEDHYAFREDGTEVSGFCSVVSNGRKEEKYYDPATGKRAEGWKYVDGTSETETHPEGWYYFNGGIPVTASVNTIRLSDDAGAVKINGEYYAFNAGGKMITGLLKAENGKYYCFGNDGVMLNGYIDVTAFGLEEHLFFDTEGSAPPRLGGTVNGLRDGRLYENGKMRTAENDRFELVTIPEDDGWRSYVVSAEGRVVRSGSVRLDSGKTMKVSKEDDNYIWQEE